MTTIAGQDLPSEEWTLEITPRSSLLYVPLADIWKFRDLLLLFVKRDFIAFYKQTILGPIWFFIQPLFTTLIYMLVFGQIARLSTDGLPQILFYLTGVTFWNYFAECFNKTATVFKDNANLFGKVYFPRIIIPLSIVLSNLVKFAVQFLLFLAIWGWFIVNGSSATRNVELQVVGTADGSMLISDQKTSMDQSITIDVSEVVPAHASLDAVTLVDPTDGVASISGSMINFQLDEKLTDLPAGSQKTVRLQYDTSGPIRPRTTALLFPLLVAIMATLGLGMGMLFSALTTKYRDLVFLLQFGVQLLMYATPVIYPFSQIPAKYAVILAWNPLAPIIESVRHGFLGAGACEPAGIVYSLTFAVTVFFIACLVFNRVEKTFMDTV